MSSFINVVLIPLDHLSSTINIFFRAKEESHACNNTSVNYVLFLDVLIFLYLDRVIKRIQMKAAIFHLFAKRK